MQRQPSHFPQWIRPPGTSDSLPGAIGDSSIVHPTALSTTLYQYQTLGSSDFMPRVTGSLTFQIQWKESEDHTAHRDTDLPFSLNGSDPWHFGFIARGHRGQFDSFTQKHLSPLHGLTTTDLPFFSVNLTLAERTRFNLAQSSHGFWGTHGSKRKHVEIHGVK